ncbi:MAG: hypothetical protein HY549_11070 [Elusimicrobia bacterium]|nr:hypothetical protein [Elusimicrobiota bacterium]
MAVITHRRHGRKIPSRQPSRPPIRYQDWDASGWAGLIGAFAFLALQLGLTPMAIGGGPWEIIKAIAGVALGSAAMVRPPGLRLIAIALAVLLPVALVYSRLLSSAISGRSRATGLILGACAGLFLYWWHAYALSWLMPWLSLWRHPLSLVAHLAWGLSMAWVYQQFYAAHAFLRR